MLKNKDHQKMNFIEGELLLIDKEIGWTSFDVVGKIRSEIKKTLNIKKIKVGHGGTLDPLASGLMIVCTGKATKRFDTLIGMDKVYTGSFFLGATTPSYDLETDIDKRYEIKHLSDDDIHAVANSFIGEQLQTPPIYSAIKINGERLYKKARKGEDVNIKKRLINIYNFSIDTISLPEVTFTIHCSKGTYIRSVANDFGKALQSGAYLNSLRRTQIGDYNIQDAWKINDLMTHLKSMY